MFESLTDKLSRTLRNLRGVGKLTEDLSADNWIPLGGFAFNSKHAGEEPRVLRPPLEGGEREALEDARTGEDGEGEETDPDSGVDEEEIPATRPSRPSRAAAAVGAAASPGEVDIVPESDVDDDVDDDDVVPASAPVRARGRPTRAAAAVRRTRGGANDSPDAFDFTEDTDDDDDEVVEESGDDGGEEEAIAVVGRRGAKRKAPAKAAAKAAAKRTRGGGGTAKKAPPAKKKSPPAKAPPGRTRAKRAVHIPYTQDEDSGEEDEEIPATATRRSTRAR